MKFEKSLNSPKAISSVSVTLILVVIAVIAGMLMFVFTIGTLATMTSEKSAVEEKVAIQLVQYASGSTHITVYAQNIGPGTVEYVLR